MKVLLEVVVSLLLHPVAFVLALVDIVGRRDLEPLQKVVWALVCLLWGLGPILYVLVGGGKLW